MKYLSTLLFCCCTLALLSQKKELTPYEQSRATEVYTPVPPRVIPGDFNLPPSDAIVLFDGTNSDAWESAKEENEGKPAQWTVNEGVLMVKPGTGDIRTKQKFKDVQLHIEFRTPIDTAGLEGQARGNSGIFFHERYEIQVLDNYNNPTYTNGQVGSIYKQSVPLANPIRKPGEWNVYDIIYTAPEFNTDGSLKTPGYMTAMLNGVLVQNHAEIQGSTAWIGAPKYTAHEENGSLRLQDHGNFMSFRNIWLREL